MLGQRRPSAAEDGWASARVPAAYSSIRDSSRCARALERREQGVCNGRFGRSKNPNADLAIQRWRRSRLLLADFTLQPSHTNRVGEGETNESLTAEAVSRRQRPTRSHCNKGHIYDGSATRLVCSVTTGRRVAKSDGECDSTGTMTPQSPVQGRVAGRRSAGGTEPVARPLGRLDRATRATADDGCGPSPQRTSRVPAELHGWRSTGIMFEGGEATRSDDRIRAGGRPPALDGSDSK